MYSKMYHFTLLALLALICNNYADEDACLDMTERSCLQEKMKNVNIKQLESDFDICCTGNLGIKTLMCLKEKRNDTFGDCVNITEKWECFMKKMMANEEIKGMLKDLMDMKECKDFKTKIKEMTKKMCENSDNDSDVEFICNNMPKE
ncbi:uncharacterized protein LOC111631779 [Centruroides sculpturatus]|uniref:uncharacterized protein LOC111631779 n=1 Tax=Centruroides sculpturatus TaxID=218467 RepID=UPI000C6C9FA5|nr:uncharacterized protein LOC111631779 [Centruroides sculpturatus]